MKRSKRYAEIAKSYDKHELVDVATAVKQIKSFNNAKFDETVEMHFRLGVDGRHADQQVRGAMVLPLFSLRALRQKKLQQQAQISLALRIWQTRSEPRTGSDSTQ